jgi:glycosyltransferase involved in cell wall biosynthesis
MFIDLGLSIVYHLRCSMAKVTVSIPTYNRCEYLKSAIESVLHQTYQDFEILISDNGSIDGTEELALSYSYKDERIKYHRFPRNQGASANWIYSLLSPSTEFVTLLPDDDLLEPDCLKCAIEQLSSHTEASVYCCKVEAFGQSPDSGNQEYFPRWMSNATSITEYDARVNFFPLLMGTPCAMPGTVFRREYLHRVHLLKDNDYAPGDYYLLAQLALHGTFLFNPQVHARYRWHDGNHTVRIRRTFRSLAQYHYALRAVLEMGLKRALSPGSPGSPGLAGLAEECESWPIKCVSDLIIAFSAIDQPEYLRRTGYQLFLKAAVRGHTLDKVGIHYRIAMRLAWIYLIFSDPVDRLLGIWWRPRK